MSEAKVVNAVNWFEIPSVDFERARKFYGAIYGVKIEGTEMYPGFKMAMLPYQNGVGGAVVQGEGYKPSADGVALYLNGGDDLNSLLEKVDGAGGQVVQPKTDIGENGFTAFFIDTEGNKVGLHSMG